MHKLKAIFAVDSENGFSKEGDLFTHNKTDLKHFKDMTINKTVVMGWNTYKSLPKLSMDYHGLKKRVNIVVTSLDSEDDYYNWSTDTVIKFRSIIQIKNVVSEQLKLTDVYIIGGPELIKHFAGEYDEIIISNFKKDYECDQQFDYSELLKDMALADTVDYLEFQVNTYRKLPYEPLAQTPEHYNLPCSPKQTDMVNEPPHYQLPDGSQVIDHIEALISNETDPVLAFYKSQVIKYNARAGHKNDALEDYKKAMFYERRMVEYLERK